MGRVHLPIYREYIPGKDLVGVMKEREEKTAHEVTSVYRKGGGYSRGRRRRGGLDQAVIATMCNLGLVYPREPLPKSYRKKNKLEVGASIPTMPSWLGGVWTEPCAHACNLGPIWLNNNELEYLDSHLVARWDKLEILDIQVNPWMCDCENQWMVSTLVKVIENKTPDLARGIM
ncbi:unnamed protein product, partial [Timema podura]|nr:unnamed protein product [Timema podura]